MSLGEDATESAVMRGITAQTNRTVEGQAVLPNTKREGMYGIDLSTMLTAFLRGRNERPLGPKRPSPRRASLRDVFRIVRQRKFSLRSPENQRWRVSLQHPCHSSILFHRESTWLLRMRRQSFADRLLENTVQTGQPALISVPGTGMSAIRGICHSFPC